jgi:hypothetical protein
MLINFDDGVHRPNPTDAAEQDGMGIGGFCQRCVRSCQTL